MTPPPHPPPKSPCKLLICFCRFYFCCIIKYRKKIMFGLKPALFHQLSNKIMTELMLFMMNNFLVFRLFFFPLYYPLVSFSPLHWSFPLFCWNWLWFIPLNYISCRFSHFCFHYRQLVDFILYVFVSLCCFYAGNGIFDKHFQYSLCICLVCVF